MSHGTHEEHHHEGPQIDIKKSKTAFSASFWFVLILAGLFIASLNFITAMSSDHEGGHDAGHTEATANQTMHGETGTGAPASHTDADKHEADHGGDPEHTPTNGEQH